jgi:hypothetical protein
MGTDALPASMNVKAAQSLDALFIDGAKADPKLAIPLDDDHTVALEAAGMPQLGGSLASVSFGTSRALLHASLEVPGKLSEAPKGAFVVLILDGSRSIRASEREAQFAAARAYLELMPDAQVQVLTFARTVKPRFSGFVKSAVARADLATLATTMKSENGSAIDDALASAGKLLASATLGAPKRVVALTDLRTRSAITPGTLSPFGAGIVVHLATIAEAGPSLRRDDDSEWAKVPRATGGLLFHGEATPDPKQVDAMRTVYEEWVRPRRVEKIVAKGVGLETSGFEIPQQMWEGEGWEDLRIAKYATPALAIEGEVWSTKIKTLLSPNAEGDKLWSALVFGSEALAQLNEKEMMVLAMKGGAVSPVTSYLAIEPGVRPSTEGLDWGGGGMGDGIGMGGLGLTGFGAGGGGGTIFFDHIAWLKSELATALGQCGGKGRKTSVLLESTRDEIVSVETKIAGAKSDDPIVTCVNEKLWALELPEDFKGSFHRWGFGV